MNLLRPDDPEAQLLSKEEARTAAADVFTRLTKRDQNAITALLSGGVHGVGYGNGQRRPWTAASASRCASRRTWRFREAV